MPSGFPLQLAHAPPGRPEGVRVVRLAAVFYGILTAGAALWVWLAESRGLWSRAVGRVGWAGEAGLGLVIGLWVVGLFILASRGVRWLRDLEEEFARALGPITAAQAVILAVFSAVGEECLFRGAMQPRWGLVITSLSFGLMHWPWHRRLWPWPVLACGAGFLLGWMAESTDGLLAPILAHAVINAVNLWRLSRRPHAAAGFSVGPVPSERVSQPPASAIPPP